MFVSLGFEAPSSGLVVRKEKDRLLKLNLSENCSRLYPGRTGPVEACYTYETHQSHGEGNETQPGITRCQPDSVRLANPHDASKGTKDEIPVNM